MLFCRSSSFNRDFVQRSFSVTSSEEPMNLLSRMRKVVYDDFPSGVKALWNDFQTYRNINDASKTLVNSWKGKIPRRQHEHQRLFRADLIKVFPTIFLWLALPGVGNIYVVVAVFLFPKYSLSRQFLNEVDRRKFLHQDYATKRRKFRNVVEAGLGHEVDLLEEWKSSEVCISYHLEDEAGPMLSTNIMIQKLRRIENITLTSLTRKQLMNLADAMTSIPLPIIMPKPLLMKAIQSHMDAIYEDDALLLGERGTISHLLDDEVIAACELRALPTSKKININHMRQVSKNSN